MAEPFFAFKFGCLTWSCTWGSQEEDWYDHDPHGTSASHSQDPEARALMGSRSTTPTATRETAHSEVTAAAHKQVWEWEEEGDVKQLILHASRSAGRQFAACALIIAVVFNHRGDEGIEVSHPLMSCNPVHIGFKGACFCEWSKAHVRFFPLLALLATSLICSRNLLCRRLYYKMLKQGAILDFENFSPLRDPLFWVLIWGVFWGFSHFAYELYTYNVTGYDHKFGEGRLEEQLQKLGNVTTIAKTYEDAKMLTVFYIAPVIMFLTFYKDAHDIEYDLLPLNKYFEQDPDTARYLLGRMPFITENRAHTIVNEGLHIHEHDMTSATTKFATSDVLQEIIERSGDCDGCDKPVSDSVFRVVSACWPAKILLDPRIKNDGTSKFKLFWRVYSSMTMLLQVVICIFFLKQIVLDMVDVLQGQISDAVSQFVAVLHLGLVLWLIRINWGNYEFAFRGTKIGDHLKRIETFAGHAGNRLDAAVKTNVNVNKFAANLKSRTEASRAASQADAEAGGLGLSNLLDTPAGE